jgi:hypothetical protein
LRSEPTFGLRRSVGPSEIDNEFTEVAALT